MADPASLAHNILTQRVMPMLVSTGGLVLSAIPMFLIAGVLLAVAFAAIDPIPPRKITIAAGPIGGTYEHMCLRYKEFLQEQPVFIGRSGIQVDCLTTEGSGENKSRLSERGSDESAAVVDAGFIGYLKDREDPQKKLFSLGQTFRQPLWVFYRKDRVHLPPGVQRVDRLAQLTGLRLSLGPGNSGGHALMTHLLELNELGTRLALFRLTPEEAMTRLKSAQGDLDAMAIVASPDTPELRPLLTDPAIGLMDFSQAEAYIRKAPQLVSTVLPRGAVDLPGNIPDQDIHLLGTAASLVVHEDTHPAVQQLLMLAAKSIHREATWSQREAEFPIGKPSWFPLSQEASRFYRNGPTQSERLLPFWMVNFFERMWVALITVLALTAPLARILPSLYTLQIRSGIFRWYAELQRIEQALAASDADIPALIRQLDEVDQAVGAIEVPLSRAHDLYDLRSYIVMVRWRLHHFSPPDPGTEMATCPQPM
jgi:TRAP-type uncharacterized transport system substrate-binding protein